MAQAAFQGKVPSRRSQSFTRAIEGRVRRFIEERGVLLPGESVLLAVSGGGDSTAMVLILHQLAAAHGWRLTVSHFDHQLRGREASAADLQFVSELARSLGLPFVSGAGDVARRARSKGESVEQAARILRYRYLSLQARASGATIVASGHTLDDQAETVMLHLIRGSGLDGLAGMRPRSPWPLGRGPELGRPLLGLRRADTQRYCRELGIEPRDDATNELLLAARNRVRHEVLPVMRRMNPRVYEALARLAEVAFDDAAALDAQAAEAFRASSQRRKGGVSLNLAALRDLRPAIRSRVLRLALSSVLGSDLDIEAAHVKAVARLVESRPGQASLVHGVVAVRDSRSLSLVRGSPAVAAEIPETPLAVPGVTEAGGWRFEAEVVDSPGSAHRRTPLEVHLDANAVSGGLWVRSRRRGDRLRPAGLGGTKKLQDIMVDAKVGRGERDGVPVVASDWGIAWVAGLCTDERAVPGGEIGRLVRLRARRIRG